MSVGNEFQARLPATWNARSPSVDRFVAGTIKSKLKADRSEQMCQERCEQICTLLQVSCRQHIRCTLLVRQSTDCFNDIGHSDWTESHQAIVNWTLTERRCRCCCCRRPDCLNLLVEEQLELFSSDDRRSCWCLLLIEHLVERRPQFTVQLNYILHINYICYLIIT